MAIDTENKRRSATGIFNVFTIAPVPDGSIDTQDRPHIGLIYSGIAISISIGIIINGDDILSIVIFQDSRIVVANQDEYIFVSNQDEYAITVNNYGSKLIID